MVNSTRVSATRKTRAARPLPYPFSTGLDLANGASLKPQPPDGRYVSKIKMRVGRKRFELTVGVDLREVTRGPGKLIEMPQIPKRSTNSSSGAQSSNHGGVTPDSE